MRVASGSDITVSVPFEVKEKGEEMVIRYDANFAAVEGGISSFSMQTLQQLYSKSKIGDADFAAWLRQTLHQGSKLPAPKFDDIGI